MGICHQLFETQHFWGNGHPGTGRWKIRYESVWVVIKRFWNQTRPEWGSKKSKVYINLTNKKNVFAHANWGSTVNIFDFTWWRLATCQIIHHTSVRINMICTKWPLEQLDPNLLGFSDDPKQLLKISKHEQSKKMIHRIANLSPWINLPSDPRIFNVFKKGPFTRVLQIAGQRVGTIAWQLRNHGIFEAHQL